MRLSPGTPFVGLKRCGPALILWTLGAIIAAPRSSAQVRATVSPVVGVYLPNGRLPAEHPGYLCPKGVPCPYYDFPTGSPEQHSAVAFGGRVTAWVVKQVAVEGSLWYSPSSVTGSTSGRSSTIIASDVRLLVGTRGRDDWAYLLAGPAFVARFGDAYTTTTGSGRLGAVVGLGVDLRVARSLGIRAEAEQYLYSVQGYHQQDFVLSVGLSVASRIGGAPTP